MKRKQASAAEAAPPASKGVEHYLKLLLRDVPLHRALVRAAECDMLAALEMPRPILDVGAGDGTFAWTLFDQPLDVGVDPDGIALQGARRLDVYRNLAQAAGAPLPFRDGTFACLLSNSTLEHIPDLDPVVAEFSRVLAKDGVCIITVPGDQFLDSTFGVRFFRFLRLRPLARAYAGWFNRISRHHHCDSPQVWNERLARAGLSLLEWRYYFSKGSTGAMDIAHYVSGPSLLTKRFLGRWVLWPGKVRFLPLARWLTPLAQPGARDTGAYLLLISRKTQ